MNNFILPRNQSNKSKHLFKTLVVQKSLLIVKKFFENTFIFKQKIFKKIRSTFSIEQEILKNFSFQPLLFYNKKRPFVLNIKLCRPKLKTLMSTKLSFCYFVSFMQKANIFKYCLEFFLFEFYHTFISKRTYRHKKNSEMYLKKQKNSKNIVFDSNFHWNFTRKTQKSRLTFVNSQQRFNNYLNLDSSYLTVHNSNLLSFIGNSFFEQKIVRSCASFSCSYFPKSQFSQFLLTLTFKKEKIQILEFDNLKNERILRSPKELNQSLDSFIFCSLFEFHKVFYKFFNYSMLKKLIFFESVISKLKNWNFAIFSKILVFLLNELDKNVLIKNTGLKQEKEGSTNLFAKQVVEKHEQLKHEQLKHEQLKYEQHGKNSSEFLIQKKLDSFFIKQIYNCFNLFYIKNIEKTFQRSLSLNKFCYKPNFSSFSIPTYASLFEITSLVNTPYCASFSLHGIHLDFDFLKISSAFNNNSFLKLCQKNSTTILNMKKWELLYFNNNNRDYFFCLKLINLNKENFYQGFKMVHPLVVKTGRDSGQRVRLLSTHKLSPPDFDFSGQEENLIQSGKSLRKQLPLNSWSLKQTQNNQFSSQFFDKRLNFEKILNLEIYFFDLSKKTYLFNFKLLKIETNVKLVLRNYKVKQSLKLYNKQKRESNNSMLNSDFRKKLLKVQKRFSFLLLFMFHNLCSNKKNFSTIKKATLTNYLIDKYKNLSYSFIDLFSFENNFFFIIKNMCPDSIRVDLIQVLKDGLIPNYGVIHAEVVHTLTVNPSVVNVSVGHASQPGILKEVSFNSFVSFVARASQNKFKNQRFNKVQSISAKNRQKISQKLEKSNLSDNSVICLLPTEFSLSSHLKNLKQIIKNSSTETQIKLIKKLTPKIYAWCYHFRFVSTFYGCFSNTDYQMCQFLWRWAFRRHTNKSKKWIRMKYFYKFNENFWIFGNSFSQTTKIDSFDNSSFRFVYLPFHSQILFHLKKIDR